MMTTMPTSSWNIFLDSPGSMKTSRLLPHTPLWVSLFRHLFTRPLTPNGRQAPSIWYLRDAPLELAHINLDGHHHLMPSSLGLYVVFLLTWAHGKIPNPTHKHHTHRSWVSTQSIMDNAYHTMRSHDPTRYIFYALCVDQLDTTLCICLDQPWIFPNNLH